MVPIEKAMRIVTPLERAQALVPPLVVPIQGRQRLVVVGVVLVDDHVVVARDGGPGKVVAPLQRPGVGRFRHARVAVRHGEDDGVVELLPVREGREVVRERPHPRLPERLDEDDAVVGRRVRLHERPVRLERRAEVGRLQVLGHDAVLVVLVARGAAGDHHARQRDVRQVGPGRHLLRHAVAEVGVEMRVLLALLLGPRVDNVDEN